jgi:transcription elongation factor GreA
VTVEDENTGATEVYNLVFGDVEFAEGAVSMSSPIGKSLVGKKLGESTVLRLPTSVRHLKLVALKTIHEM